jgi:hypothetical protein
MNRMTPDELAALDDKSKKPPKSSSKAPPEERAALKVYTVDKKPVMPVENFMACMIEAGKYIRLDGKRQVSTSKASMLPGLLTIESPVLWLSKPNGKPPQKWGVAEWRYEIRQGRNPNGGEAVAIVRPRFDEWAFRGVIDIDTVALSEDAYRTLLDIAGKRIGLCDFRPERKGTFGQFRVDNWEPLD